MTYNFFRILVKKKSITLQFTLVALITLQYVLYSLTQILTNTENYLLFANITNKTDCSKMFYFKVPNRLSIIPARFSTSKRPFQFYALALLRRHYICLNKLKNAKTLFYRSSCLFYDCRMLVRYAYIHILA